MPLDHYVTLGRSGLRVSPLCLGAMTFGEDLGWGSSVEESQQIIDRYLERGGNFIDTANVYTKGHSEKIIGDHLGRHAGAARPRRHRDEVQRQPLPRRSRTAAARAASRSSPRARSRCAACRPTTSTSTGCTPGTCTRRSRRRCARSTTSCARARSATSASPTRRRGRSPRRNVIGAVPRLVAVHRAADRVLAPRAHGRGGARPHGAGARPRHHAVVAAQERRAEREVHAEERGPGEGRSRRSSSTRASTRRPTRSSTSSRSSPRRTTAPSPAWRSPGCRRSPG